MASLDPATPIPSAWVVRGRPFIIGLATGIGVFLALDAVVFQGFGRGEIFWNAQEKDYTVRVAFIAASAALIGLWAFLFDAPYESDRSFRVITTAGISLLVAIALFTAFVTLLRFANSADEYAYWFQ